VNAANRSGGDVPMSVAPPAGAMHLEGELERLRQYLEELAAADDEELDRYQLARPQVPPGLYWKLRWMAGRALRWLESKGLKRPDRWPAGLKQVPGSERAQPLLLWAVGTDPGTLRAACRALAEQHAALPGYAPVLVTDVADFAFFSRLGWLVEYLPSVSGVGPAYDVRKARFLARLYRGAPAIPVTATLQGDFVEELRRWIEKRPR
jgi:hypothetical protein